MPFATVVLDTGANFPADLGASAGTISGGDLTLTSNLTDSAVVSAVSSVFQTTSTFFFEVRVGAATGAAFIGGIRQSPGNSPNSTNRKPYSFGVGGNFTVVSGDYVEYAVDLTAGKMWVGKNGVWQSGDPALNTSPSVTWTPGGDWYAYGLAQSPNGTGGNPPANAGSLTFNFGDSPFHGQIPGSYRTLGNHYTETVAQVLPPFTQALAAIANEPNPYYYSWFKDQPG